MTKSIMEIMTDLLKREKISHTITMRRAKNSINLIKYSKRDKYQIHV